MLKVAIGADDAATTLKNQVKTYLQEKGIEVVDFSHDVAGNDQMYPDIAFNLASSIREGNLNAGSAVRHRDRNGDRRQ
jgi:ribose 5-phosphate isomerase B